MFRGDDGLFSPFSLSIISTLFSFHFLQMKLVVKLHLRECTVLFYIAIVKDDAEVTVH